MKIKQIRLSKYYKALKSADAILTIYLPSDNECVSSRNMILICPGGGYVFVSRREAEPIAIRFIAEGFAAAVLTYSTNSAYPIPHLELGAAISYLKTNAKKFNITLDLCVVGFSAGGHLVASYSYCHKEIKNLLKCRQNIKPDVIVLGYPVISPELDNSNTTKLISNNENHLLEKMSINRYITKDYPPTFIFTSKADKVVPYENSEVLVNALKENKVKYEYLLYDTGEHGASLANRAVYSKNQPNLVLAKDMRDWVSKAADFIYSIFDK